MQKVVFFKIFGVCIYTLNIYKTILEKISKIINMNSGKNVQRKIPYISYYQDLVGNNTVPCGKMKKNLQVSKKKKNPPISVFILCRLNIFEKHFSF